MLFMFKYDDRKLYRAISLGYVYLSLSSANEYASFHRESLTLSASIRFKTHRTKEIRSRGRITSTNRKSTMLDSLDTEV